MSARQRFVLFTLSLAIVFAARAESARALSDRLVVTDPAGVVLFDGSVDDTAAGGTELSLAFGAPVDPFATTNIIIVMTEPAGEPPGESSIFVPGTNEIISDLVLSPHASPGGPFGVLFLSDGNPLVSQIVSLLPGLPFTVLAETGDLQDLSALLGSDPLKVQVQSDVVPEPGTLLLFGAGLVGLAAGARRGRRLRS